MYLLTGLGSFVGRLMGESFFLGRGFQAEWTWGSRVKDIRLGEVKPRAEFTLLARAAVDQVGITEFENLGLM